MKNHNKETKDDWRQYLMRGHNMKAVIGEAILMGHNI